MKKLKLYLHTIISLLILLPGLLSAHYGPRGLVGGNVTCGTHYNGIVYLGTQDGGVFEATNNTLVAWRLRAVGLKSGKINALLHSTTQLYTATSDSGVYIFNGYAGTDRYWNKRNNGLTNLNILSLAAVDTNIILAGSNGNGLFRTTNKGLVWTPVNSPSLNNTAITSLVKCGARIVALVNNTGAFASDDGGLTWFNFNDANTNNITNSKFLTYNAANDQLLLYNNNGLFVCSSASTTATPAYTLAQNNLPNGTIVRNISNNGANWYIASQSGVFTTATTSINWITANTSLPTMSVGVVVAMTNTLIAGTTKMGAFKSIVTSVNWAANNTGMTNINVYSIACKGDSIVATATEYGAVISKTLGLNPWIRNNGLTDSLNINDLEFGDNLLFAATKNGGVFVTSDLGFNWTQQNTGLTMMNIKRITYANGIKYAIDAAGKVFQSNLMATTWVQITNGLPPTATVTSMAFIGNYVIAGTYGNGVYKKHRDSTNWIAFNTSLSNMNVTAVTTSNEKVFAGTDGSGVMVSDIATAAWAPTSVITSTHFTYVPLSPSQINRIQYMYSVKGYVVASFNGGLVATEDDGTTWGEAGTQFNLPSYSNYNKISHISSRIFVTTEKNNAQSNAMSEFALVDSLLNVNENLVTASPAGITNYHSVTSNLVWSASSNAAWVVPSVSSGTWNANISLQIAPNTGSARSAIVTLTGATKTVTILVNQAGLTGLNAQTLSTENISIYPNPNSGKFAINTEGAIGLHTVIISDISGREIALISVKGEKNISVSEDLLPGIYFVQLKADKGTTVKKIIVE
ncbi:MAG: T9SS type A sorting domain-containing protein [Sphingobacteriaceae bacterium]